MTNTPTRCGVPVIGMTGGIGSGKSSIVRQVTSVRLRIIDADRIGHDVLKRPHIRTRVVRRFGDCLLNSDGQISRPELARLVFGDSPDQRQALQDLNAIVHPEIRNEIQAQINAVPEEETDAIIVDAALLLEARWSDLCDALVFVDTPLPLRQQRVAKRDWSAREHADRERSQLPVEEKRRRSHCVIDNSGTLESAVSQLEQAIRHLIQEKSARR